MSGFVADCLSMRQLILQCGSQSRLGFVVTYLYICDICPHLEYFYIRSVSYCWLASLPGAQKIGEFFRVSGNEANCWQDWV